jgi:predicted ATPase/DNA-binding SARP family transcriptional activator
MPEQKLFLLGPPRLERDGELVRINRRKALALLCYVAVTDQTHRRETLATLFWPDTATALAHSYLRRDLSVLNKELGPGCLDVDRDQVGPAREGGAGAGLWVDVNHFRRLLQECETHDHPSDETCPQCMPLLGEAVALHRGDFMTGFSLPDSSGFDDWQLFEQETLRRELTTAIHALVRGHSAQGEYEAGIAYTRRWLQLAPWDEKAHRQLMVLLTWDGDRSAALRHYHECVRVLEDELDQPPDGATLKLYEAIRDGQPPTPPVLAESPAPPPPPVVVGRALPPASTPFVNRASELAEIEELLVHEPACRLLTLVGPGGIGKTRLALQAASQVLDAFPSGVQPVPLAPIQSADLLIPTIAYALGLVFQGRLQPQAQLFNYLREKVILLLLDNFEHLLEGAELLPKILEQAPGVKLIVTSRVRLNLRAEWVRHVQGLDYPTTDDLELAPALDEAVSGMVLKATGGVSSQGYSSVRLFLESVRRVVPDFHLSQEERVAVVRICRLVEGMPLGLELAAAWARVIPILEIEQEIRRSLDFLSTEMRDVPARHRDLRAVFEQSWRLLSENEQQVIGKLSVFQGGFDRPAAEQVAGATPFVLAALVDKSMVRTYSSGNFDMHELLRQFATERLGSTPGAHQEARDRHCTHFAVYLQEREKLLKGAQQQTALNEIAANIDNVRAAWRWAIENDKVTEIGQGLESLHLFYYARGWVHEGHDALRDAAAKLEPADSPGAKRVLGRLLARQGRFAYRLGMHREAGELARKSLVLFGQAGTDADADTRRDKAFGLFCLSAVLRGDGEYQEAHRLCQQSYDLFRESGDRPGMAMALKLLGIISGSLETYAEAQRQLQEALELYQDIGDPYGIANTLNDLAVVSAGLDQYASVRRFHRECLTIRRQIGDLWGIGTTLNNLGYLAYLDKDYSSAKELLQESLLIQREIGDQYHIANCLNNLGAAACALGEQQDAAEHLHKALQIAFEIGASPLVLEIMGEIGALLATTETGDGTQAAKLLAFVRHHPLTDGWTRERAERVLAQLAPDLPLDAVATAREKGQAGELAEIVVDVLSHQDTWLSQADGQVDVVSSL